MSEDDFVIHLERCNRCGWRGFEKLTTHSYCTNCNFSPDADDVSGGTYAVIPDWAIAALKSTTPKATNAGVKPESDLITALAAVFPPSALSA
jgi:hypothetical protein